MKNKEFFVRVSKQNFKGLKTLKEKTKIPLAKLADQAVENYLKARKIFNK